MIHTASSTLKRVRIMMAVHFPGSSVILNTRAGAETFWAPLCTTWSLLFEARPRLFAPGKVCRSHSTSFIPSIMIAALGSRLLLGCSRLGICPWLHYQKQYGCRCCPRMMTVGDSRRKTITRSSCDTLVRVTLKHSSRFPRQSTYSARRLGH